MFEHDDTLTHCGCAPSSFYHWGTLRILIRTLRLIVIPERAAADIASHIYFGAGAAQICTDTARFQPVNDRHILNDGVYPNL